MGSERQMMAFSKSSIFFCCDCCVLVVVFVLDEWKLFDFIFLLLLLLDRGFFLLIAKNMGVTPIGAVWK